MLFAQLVEAKHISNHIPSPTIVKVMWVSEDYDIPTTNVGPFDNDDQAADFIEALNNIDPDGQYIYSAETTDLSLDSPDSFIKELKELM